MHRGRLLNWQNNDERTDMNNSKRLSVIIPGYNNPQKYWERCLKSVLANIGEDDEVICVDDGSHQCPEFLRTWASRDRRIVTIFLDKNCGLPVARNSALLRVRGEYVTFVDSDDELCEGVYENALKQLHETKADVAVFGVKSIWVNEGLYKVNMPHVFSAGILDKLDVSRLYVDSLLNYAWNKVFRREFLSQNNIVFNPDGVPCEDIIFVLKCIVAGAKWVPIHKVGINYYRTHNSLLSRYKSTYVKGSRFANAAWLEYGRSYRGADMCGMVSEPELQIGEWDNIWRKGSPFSLVDRYKFARSHPELYMSSSAVFFMKKFVFCILRKWFYLKPIQRWHIRRTYPDVVEVRSR